MPCHAPPFGHQSHDPPPKPLTTTSGLPLFVSFSLQSFLPIDLPSSIINCSRSRTDYLVISHLNMTRSHKHNDRDHQGLRDGTASDEQHLPRYFAKAGYVDNDPKKVKKDGSGKANWGNPGDDVQDGGYNLHHARRRSNSSVEFSTGFRTKFEAIEHEPVFEEELHGDHGVDAYAHEHEEDAAAENGADLERFDSMSKSSVSSGESVEEEVKKI